MKDTPMDDEDNVSFDLIENNKNKILKKFELFDVDYESISLSTDCLVDNFKSEKTQEEFTCSICMCLVKNPRQCQKCEKLFCDKCIIDWLKRDKKCSNCREEFKDNSISRFTRNILNELIISCHFCSKVINYENLFKHFQICELAIRKAKCLSCNSTFKATSKNDGFDKHKEECLEEIILCPKEGCNIYYKRGLGDDHKQYCMEDCSRCGKLIRKNRDTLIHSEEECDLFLKCKDLEKEVEEKILLISTLNEQFNKAKSDLQDMKKKYSKIKEKKDDKFFHKNNLKIERLISNDISFLRSCSSSNYNATTATTKKSQSLKKKVSNNFKKACDEWREITSSKISSNLYDHVSCLIQIKTKNDDSIIASCTQDYSIKIWDLSLMNEQTVPNATLCGHTLDIISLIQLKWCFNETYLLSGSSDTTIKLWDVQEKKCIRTMLGHTNPVNALIQLKWSKNEYTVISSSYSSSMVFFTKGEIKTWNALNGTCLSTINGHSDIISCIKGIKWSFDDSTIMTGSYDYLIKIWDITNGICINTLKEHTEPVICIIQMKWDKNDMTIISGSMDNTIKIWEIFSTSDNNSSNSLMTLKGHTSYVLCLKQIKNLKNKYTIISGSKDTTVKVWNLDGYVCIKTLKAHQSYVNNILQIKSKRNEENLLITTGKKELKMWIF